MFHGSAPHRFTFWEAKAYCLSHGAELATTAQLYAAWNDGLNHCSPGWLADGSVRYPIVTPRERCGGGEPGVRTVYRFSNQTGFPEVHTRHDVYCFRSKCCKFCLLLKVLLYLIFILYLVFVLLIHLPPVLTLCLVILENKFKTSVLYPLLSKWPPTLGGCVQTNVVRVFLATLTPP